MSESGPVVTEAIKLLIVDDHPLFRQGLVDVLNSDPGILVVGEAVNGETALKKTREHHPDVILMDVNLPGSNGLQITRQILSEFPQTKIIILTAYDHAEQIYHSLQIGAAGYCTKDISPEVLVMTIMTVYHGQYVIQDQVMTNNDVLSWLRERSGRYAGLADEIIGPSTTLSPREMEILELVTQGISNKDIAQRLAISQQTVKNHMTAILRKLQVSDRTQAAIYALRHGWVRLEDQ